MANRRAGAIVALIQVICALCAFCSARAQQSIGSTTAAKNQVTREVAGASAPLMVGDSVYLNEVVRTGVDSLAKLVFLDSTNLAVGPISRVVLDQFVYVGQVGAQKMAVNLAKGIFRFTTGALDKKAYVISTPTASIGVRGTVLDIDSRSSQSRITLVEGRALVCPRRKGITFEQQAAECARGGRHCECEELTHPGQTALVRKVGGSNQASLTSTPVNTASLCSDPSVCSSTSYASAGFGQGFGGALGGGALCGR
jgi:hypothetical protein